MRAPTQTVIQERQDQSQDGHLWALLEWRPGLSCSYPDMMERLLPFCGSARTSDHNKVHTPALHSHALPLCCVLSTVMQRILQC